MRGYHVKIILQRKKETSRGFPFDLFRKLPAHKIEYPKLTGEHPDYRRGLIRVDWMEFEDSKTANQIALKEKEQGRGTLEAIFWPHAGRKFGSTNLSEGTIHLYRDAANKPSQDQLKNAATPNTLPTESDGVMLGVLAVPAWMTPSDFLAFVAPATEGITHLRIIRDASPNRSIVLIKFANPTHVAEFAEAYNGKPFNSTEPEICHVVHVVSVVIDAEDTVSQAISRLSISQATMYELPTCPVCLERMDSAVTGLITVPCSHTFHCMCLSKWGDSRCPVCRYSQTLLSSHPTSSTSTRSSHPIPFANVSNLPLSSCASCSSTTNLWICLICGNIGCGRYGSAHAQSHYQNTTHLYALELETQRVWDYAGDGYVHRLIQNKADGKLVELPSAASSMGAVPREGGLGPSQADALSAEKIEAIGIEYSYLLTSQLDSQRSYYEEQTTELTSQVGELRVLLERLSQDFENERRQVQADETRRQIKEEEKLKEITKEKVKAETRAQKAAELARKFDKELKEEKAVSEGLMKNMAVMKAKVQSAEKEKDEYTRKITDLEDQVRDLMFFLEAKNKIEDGGGVEAEAAGGSVELPAVNTKKKKIRK